MTEPAIYFRLQGEEPVPCTVLEWGEIFERYQDRMLWRDEITEDVAVATMFHGFDPDYATRVYMQAPDPGQPLLFGTLVKGGPLSGAELTYPTYARAKAGHEAVTALVRARARLVRD